jgi:hypothetical protein
LASHGTVGRRTVRAIASGDAWSLVGAPNGYAGAPGGSAGG